MVDGMSKEQERLQFELYRAVYRIYITNAEIW